MCIGTTLAAGAAFAISRGVGRPLAEKLIRKEIDEIEADMSMDSTNNLESKLQFVHDAIEHGSWWKQAGAIFLLRLTPVVPFRCRALGLLGRAAGDRCRCPAACEAVLAQRIGVPKPPQRSAVQLGEGCAQRLTGRCVPPRAPCSASNYLLGLTPLPLAPYLVGTVAGMGCWSVVYASLGGASRSLLAKGVSADALLAGGRCRG